MSIGLLVRCANKCGYIDAGVVQKEENGRVYTVEGNSNGSVRQNSYPAGYYEISVTESLNIKALFAYHNIYYRAKKMMRSK